MGREEKSEGIAMVMERGRGLVVRVGREEKRERDCDGDGEGERIGGWWSR